MAQIHQLGKLNKIRIHNNWANNMQQQSQENDSFFQEDPIDVHTNIQKMHHHQLLSPNAKFFINSVTNRFVTQNIPIHVLQYNQKDQRIDSNNDFQHYLNTQLTDVDLTIVSFVGNKKCGKSFLIDSLITADNGKISRVMSRHPKCVVSTTTYNYYNYKDGKIYFFDAHGQMQHQTLMWLYFMSSIIVLNLEQKDRSQENKFIKQLKDIDSHLVIDNDCTIEKPQLIIVRRDCVELCQKDVQNERQFIQRVKETKLFNSNINTINIPFPGNTGIRPKQILDIPLSSFCPSFNHKVKLLQHMLKKAEPKCIHGSPFTQKILAFSLLPLKNSVRQDRTLYSHQIWNQIVQEYSIGFKNVYLRQFANSLDSQTNKDQCKSDYEMYDIFRRARRNADKKTIQFLNLSGDPIFQQYRRSVEREIGDKEQEIRRLNNEKIHLYNEQICEQGMTRINIANYHKIIDEYNKECRHEYHKSEILLDKLSLFMSDGLIGDWIETNSNNKENGEIEEDSRDVVVLQIENSNKQRKIRQLEEQYQQLRNRKQKNEQVVQIDQQMKQIVKRIKERQQQLEILKDRKGRLIADRCKQIQKQLQLQDQQIFKFKSLVSISGNPKKQANIGAKNTCCFLI